MIETAMARTISPVKCLSFGLLALFLVPVLCCGATKLIPYLVGRLLWALRGATDYKITLIQGRYANLNPYLMPNTSTLLQVRGGQVVAVYLNGKPSSIVPPEKYWDSTIEGLFNKSLQDISSPFIRADYNTYYGYPERIYGGFIEGGGVAVSSIEIETATPSFSPSPTPNH